VLYNDEKKRINSTPSLNASRAERRKSQSGGRHGSKTRCNKLSSHPINWTLPSTPSVATRRSDHDTVSLPTTPQLVHSTGRSVNGLVRIYNDVEHFIYFMLFIGETKMSLIILLVYSFKYCNNCRYNSLALPVLVHPQLLSLLLQLHCCCIMHTPAVLVVLTFAR